jgi:hypothetical protein
MTEIAAESLDIADVASYLASTGWRRRGEWRGGGLWTREGAPEVLVPERRGFRDEAERLRDVMRVLVDVEDRPEVEIVQDILDPLVDKQVFRTQPDTPSGTIPLPGAIKALEGIRDLLGAAARSLLESPRLVFAGQRGRETTDFLAGVRLGTTKPGSYILVTRVPLRPAAGGDGRGAPFGRRVVERLHQAVTAAHAAANEVAGAGRRESFVEAVQQGVSANLCEALSALGGVHADRPFEVGFSWARGLPSDRPAARLRFSETLTRIVAQGGKDLRELDASGRATIVGRIERLVFDPPPHRVLVRGRLESRGRTEEGSVWVRLNQADYERASREHHRPGVLFRFSGHLLKTAARTDMILDQPGIDVIESG